jgi:hypothetical protein
VVPKLLDFGIAKALSSADSTLSSVALGTPSYMAPEQALGCVAPGPAADVWSMAVVLVRCLTGRLPFAAVREKGPSVSSFAFDAASADDVPRPIIEVLARALQLDPRDRFPNMAELRSALQEALRAAADGVSWPSEITVAYYDREFELAAHPALQRGGLDASASGKNSRAARPAEILTRTLSRAWQAAYERRWERAVLGACLGLVGASALYLSASERRESRSETDPRSGLAIAPAERASRAGAAPATGLAGDSLHVRAGATTSAAGEAEPLAAASADSGGAKARAVSPKPRSLPSASSSESRESAQAPQASVPLGPNRSPIIE